MYHELQMNFSLCYKLAASRVSVLTNLGHSMYLNCPITPHISNNNFWGQESQRISGITTIFHDGSNNLHQHDICNAKNQILTFYQRGVYRTKAIINSFQEIYFAPCLNKELQRYTKRHQNLTCCLSIAMWSSVSLVILIVCSIYKIGISADWAANYVFGKLWSTGLF